MKLLIARLNHETNTFSPVPTPLAAFDPQWDDDARRSQQGMRTAMAAFLDAAARRGDTVVTPVAATANPSGRVDEAAYEQMVRHIVACAPGCSGAAPASTPCLPSGATCSRAPSGACWPT